MKTLIKKICEKASLPFKKNENDPGYHLSACIDEPIIIMPHTKMTVPSGIAIVPPKNTFVGVFPDDDMVKKGIRLANGVGVGDEDYRGDYCGILFNDTDSRIVINNNDIICQVIFIPYISLELTDEGITSNNKTVSKALIKKMNKKAIFPFKRNENSPGYCLTSCSEEQILIMPHTHVSVPTGISIIPPENMFVGVFADSKMAKKGVRLASSVEVGCGNSEAEYYATLYNDSNSVITITKGEVVCQTCFIPYISSNLILTDELENTERGIGGFGSTGK